MSGRRAEDKRKVKLSRVLAALACALSVFAIVIGWKAIIAIDKFDRAMSAVLETQPKKSLVPEGY